jgi:dolichol-phosphate mannosyltransferase
MTQLTQKPPAPDSSQPGAVWVVLPTYDERGNLESIVTAIRAQLPFALVLVVDDSSPDGTGDIADLLAGTDLQVRVLHRTAKEGLWPAYVAGIDTALAAGARVVVQMDADWSHDPAVLPELVGAVRSGYDLAMGSRYVPGGGTSDWPLSRRVVSRGGNLFAQLILGLPYPDTTGGFRAWRADFLRLLDFRSIRATGYVCMIEMAYRAHRQGANVRQVPITFMNRRAGESKMSGSIFVEALVQVVKLRITEWARHRRGTRTSW